MRRILRGLRDLFRVNRGSVAIFEILYRTFTALVMIEAAVHGMDQALKQAGFSYLTSRNALRFFCSPWTILIFAGILLLGAFFLNLEISTLYTAYQASAAGERLGPLKMFLFGFKNLAELFRCRNGRTVFLNINYYLLTGGWMLLALADHARPLNYIIMTASGFLPVKLLFWAALAVMTAVSLLYIYVPVTATLRDIPFKEACAEGREIFRAHWLATAGLLILANGFVWVFFKAGQAVLKFLAALVILAVADSSSEMALALTAGSWIETAMLILSSVLSLCLNMGVQTFLLYRYQDQKYRLEIPRYHSFFSPAIRKGTAALLVFVLAGAGGFAAWDSFYAGAVRASSITAQAQITSHRGSSYEAPENTLPAIEKAIEDMADYVEIDVQETKDGVVVVYHDSSLRRITGDAGRIWEYTYGELLLMDFGGWFSEEYAGTQIPTLEQVLELCRGRIAINIELKADRVSETLVEKTLELVELYGMEGQVVISSTDYGYLRQVKELKPDIPTGYILFAAYGRHFDDENIDFLSVRSDFVTNTLVKSAHEAGKAVHAWTVNAEREITRMKHLQVDNIITDRPLLAREVLYREEGTEGILEFLKEALR